MTTKLSIPVVDLSGKTVGDLSAPAELFGIEPNESVVHFVCEGQRFRFYKKNAVTKTRSAVNGGGKKNRKQKGTGGARQGGNRAPHWVGGGVVFGPSGVKRDFKVNKKVRRLALASILSDRFSGGQIRILKEGLSGPKTKTVSKLIHGLSLDGARVGFVVSSEKDLNLIKSARNIKGVDVLNEVSWTPLDFIKTDSLIFSEESFKKLTGRFLAGAEG